MHRAFCEITDPDEMARILESTQVGRLATIDGQGYPYITPVNFVYYRSAVYFHGAPRGEKLDNLARDSRVCFEADVPLAYVSVDFNEAGNPCHTHQLYHSVVIRGRAGVLPDGDLKTIVLNALVAKHEGHAGFRPITPDSPEYKACLVVEVKPERMTGKTDLAQNKPRDGRRREIAEHLAARGLPGDLEAVREMGFEIEGDSASGRRLKPE
ncbi:MAG: pyridoxamine 5'-phosphate oxidase family protein [Proteobacteria bacterium]|nr:pyridoxamine 5'-phosphate oxidase family protein [Pseudomonadota bacterium]